MKKSIVFRGTINDLFHKNLVECRKWFDGEIVLSTWNDQHVDDSWNLDKVVLSEDPGPTYEYTNPSLKYSYRQIFAAQEGVKKASGDLILLTRTDMCHTKDLFKYYNADKILCGNMMTIDPDYPHWHPKEKCFRICDWFQLSNKSTIEQFSHILKDHSYYLNTGLCMEQIWSICFLNKKYNYKINPHSLEKHYNSYWNILLNHYNIKNTISTLGSINMNWQKQPEKLECYLTEDKITNRSNL